jgi:hypothetical protein
MIDDFIIPRERGPTGYVGAALAQLTDLNPFLVSDAPASLRPP